MAVVEHAEFAKHLADADPSVRIAGLEALKTASQAEAHAAKVAELICDQSSSVRQAAVDALREMGSKAAGQAGKLGGYVAGQNAGTAAAAAFALAALGEAAVASEIPALKAALELHDEDVSGRALVIAGVARSQPPALRKRACAAAAALAAAGAEGTSAAPLLAECLKDKDADLRVAAVLALGAMGRIGAQYETQALEQLQDPAPSVAAAACEALGRMARSTSASEAAAEAVADLLKSKHPQVRVAAARGLADMGSEAEVHAEALARLVFDSSPGVQVEAVRTLAACGETGQMYASQVARLLQSPYPRVRAEACRSLKAMGERGAAYSEEVWYLTEDPEWEVQEAAALAVEAFNGLSQAGRALEAGTGGQTATALLFPGQGSQYIGMLKDVKEMPIVRDMLEKAKTVLGYDILDLCLHGPEARLESTEFCQPAMYIGGLAAVELLRKDRPEAADRPAAVAGLSLGEYTALTVAGVLDFETGLRLVKLRAEAMQEASDASLQSMASIAGLERNVLETLCAEAVASVGGTCKIANFLFPKGFTCSGSKATIEKLIEEASKNKDLLQAKTVKLSGAFHTELMAPAKEKLLAALKNAEAKMSPPTCDIYMNLTGERIAAGTRPSELVPLLAEQLCSCVLWEPSIKAMIGNGITHFYECGPMKQLTAMMKRIDQNAHKNTQSINV
mmetsp:Transcript_29877/g.86831  ORF Transcript_29877/g.86831 Transcript_29877/m.86831 type:complete len:680 (+) Transcript_29877:87-2126(+)|eukprot:CAMPEP_0170297842 /NCGR_PEP_ID=MMETSP0116_2-20130129/49085_1 /TAXON_ID=400756 /ORGANISM="Durinskia baltica, Strain CSIRO CS-38" /LENGTH=679 /DNA_ID=CAMNT_0010549473 /DNA_START=80 /DNA_END=2119 /DNA_ORIENTATION=-